MANVQANSVDPKEVAYYQQLAYSWWQNDGPFWPLHKLNQLRIKWILAELRKITKEHQPLAGKRVLDIGCGGGILSESLAKHGAQVTAIDVVEKNIMVAKTHAKQSRLDINYQLMSVEQMQQQQTQFDMVFNMEVVEHVNHVEQFMHCCNALVKPGGMQFIASINRNWLAFIVAIFGAEYVTRLLPIGTHHYHKLVKPSEVQAFLAKDGLTVLADSGVAVNPIKRSMKLAKHTWINYMLMAQKTTS